MDHFDQKSFLSCTIQRDWLAFNNRSRYLTES
jgi:hypothetical protein